MDFTKPFKRPTPALILAYRLGRGEGLTRDEQSLRTLLEADPSQCKLPGGREAFERGRYHRVTQLQMTRYDMPLTTSRGMTP